MTTETLPLWRFARNSDPATSKGVAGEKKNRVRWGSQRHLILEEFSRVADLTDEEAGIASGLHQKHACYWKRCGELRDFGLIADKGITRKSLSGNDVIVSSITLQGLEKIKELENARRAA